MMPTVMDFLQRVTIPWSIPTFFEERLSGYGSISMRCFARVLTFALVWVIGLAGVAWAEKVDMTPEEMQKTATHIVVGKAEQIFARTEKAGNYEYTRYVAEVRVDKVEKGDGFEPGDLMYVRYWHKRWLGPGDPPPDTSGHRGEPAPGDTMRFYTSKNAYDGFGTTKDGGYNVLGANGFEKVKTPAKKVE
jgi:hypothetical protein